jgi:calcium/proton exchanger cax
MKTSSSLFVCEPLPYIQTAAYTRFEVSFLAIIPLASLLGFATEDISLRVGQTLAGLLSATLGNA